MYQVEKGMLRDIPEKYLYIKYNFLDFVSLPLIINEIVTPFLAYWHFGTRNPKWLVTDVAQNLLGL